MTPAPSRPRTTDDTASEGGPTLPPWKAFVVQFSLDSAVPTGVFAGRVEHLSSARRVRFNSKESLLVVLERLLDDIERVSR